MIGAKRTDTNNRLRGMRRNEIAAGRGNLVRTTSLLIIMGVGVAIRENAKARRVIFLGINHSHANGGGSYDLRIQNDEREYIILLAAPQKLNAYLKVAHWKVPSK